MENVADALILAFAVLIFTMALGLSMNTFSKARQTSDIVLSTVEEKMSTEYEEGVATSLSYRKVGMETIIPTLYRYYKENLTVVFMQGNLDEDTGEITNVRPLTIYKSLIPSSDWEVAYKGSATTSPSYGYKLNDKDSGNICVFDVTEENNRHEYFGATDAEHKSFIDAILQGKTYSFNYRGNKTYDFSNILNNELIKYEKAKYLELISREDKSALSGNKTTRKTIITYIRYATS